MPKTQASIASFFGGGARTPAPAAADPVPDTPADEAALGKRQSVSPASARKRLRPASELESGKPGQESAVGGESPGSPGSPASPVEPAQPVEDAEMAEAEPAPEAEEPAEEEKGEEEEEADEAEAEDDDDARNERRRRKDLPEPSWAAGEPVPYLAFAEVLAQIEAVTSRLRIQELLTTLFRQILITTPDDLLTAVYLACNSVAPAYMNVEIGVGDSLLIKAIVAATGRTTAAVKAAYETQGDLGSVAQASRANQRMLFKPKPLTINKVLETMRSVANEKGSRSQDKKVSAIQKLLVSGRESEPKYLMRAMQGKLRIGLAESTVLVSLAHAVVRTPHNSRTRVPSTGKLPEALEAAVVAVKDAYSQCSSYETLVAALTSNGLSGLGDACALRPGVPVAPMLAKPTKGISEILNRFSGVKFTMEYKYDGERAQIHLLPDGSVKVFSRSLEDTSTKYLDVVANMPHAVGEGVSSFVIDTEVVAYDKATGRLLPFQILSSRSRKNTSVEDLGTPVIIKAFDCLYMNGESLLKRPLAERRAVLQASFREVEHEFGFAMAMESSDVEEINSFLNESVEGCCEGLMVKTLETNASYEPSRRTFNWVKLKKDYIDGVGDSFDLVPIGAIRGRGKRTGVFGAYILAAYDPDSEEFQSVTKIGTGFSDTDLREHTERLSQHEAANKPLNYRCDITPDVWFNPVEVWEVRAADLSISPVHKAAFGRVDPNKGIALRFPRFLRIRDDKPVENATSAAQVAEMYLQQSSVSQGGSAAGAGGMEDDEFL